MPVEDGEVGDQAPPPPPPADAAPPPPPPSDGRDASLPPPPPPPPPPSDERDKRRADSEDGREAKRHRPDSNGDGRDSRRDSDRKRSPDRRRRSPERRERGEDERKRSSSRDRGNRSPPRKRRSRSRDRGSGKERRERDKDSKSSRRDDKERERESRHERDRERGSKSDRDREKDARRDDRERERGRDRRDDRDRDRRDDRDRHRDRDRRDQRDSDHRSGGGSGKGGQSSGNGLDAKREEEEEDDEPLDIEFDEDEDAEAKKEEELRKKREAILAKARAKAAGGGGGGAAPTPPQSTGAPAPPSNGNGSTAAAAAAVGEAGKGEGSGEDSKGAGEGGERKGDEEEGDDMFGAKTPVVGVLPGQGSDRDADGTGETDNVDRRMGVTNADNWDDAEGYFRTRPGEVIVNRYKVMRDIGHGVYSTVVSASDEMEGNMEVAIKLIRSNETMYKAGRKEIEILTKLAKEDPEGKRHICKLLGHFEYKNHLCMVFVPAEMNLRKLLKTYGREVGITLQSIKVFAKQLMIGLHHMVKCRVVHGDIKLDNILITKDLRTVSICDFGTADWSNECTITPYMVSRYYRPPEICLGLRYGHPMDLWSVGVCLFELYTGKFMFTGRSNNEMLKQFMDYKGPPSKRMLRQAQFKDQHFEEDKADIVFKYLTKDVVTKMEIIQKIKYTEKPQKSILEALKRAASAQEDVKKVKEFADFLEKIFVLDPERRITVGECLKHPFLQ